ncbi:putative helicase [Caldalkalibacillus uzonensis]|uniref:Helicase n=1 Tax=Caldalkalibacillus uzonensis TaxID=353224 RepID=A0ABU0CWY2_9BACI|nr:type ISP restriction/modification enzyme [Caldalkalibacillus uzonensis]MDQ0340930.1 putative helicase [Caldalkalibacillus uzonensis]
MADDLSFVKKDLRPYQQEAINAVIDGFSRIDRGKLIMPPGAGKTFTALKLSERYVGAGGRVLFMAPSIALVEQPIRAWMEDTDTPLRIFAVTSDHTVGRTDDDQLGDTSILSYPPTTNADELIEGVLSVDDNHMTVVVSTYHSSQVIADAQKNGLPEFDLIIADEAHRTTGVVKAQDPDDSSYYHMVHDNNLIKGKKRLYMTATPRVFIPRVKKKLDEGGYDFYSMDDKEVYGEEFYRLGFGQAVERGILSDYKVVILTVDETEVHEKLLEYLNREDSPEVTEAAKMIGCWRALNGYLQNTKIEPLKRAVVFTGKISESRQFARKFRDTVELYASDMINEVTSRTFEVVHVDGSMTASERKQKIAWLKQSFDSKVTRILSNAKVLTEGIDVPALDAVVFMRPRRSVVDIVQAVGRVMRKAEGKQYGYVIIPVLANPEQDPEEALDKNEEFKTVWEVLGALRSIDDRLDAEVRSVWLKATKSNKATKYIGDDDDKIIIDVEERWQQLAADLFGEKLRRALIGRIVERVGDRRYFETWAKDVAEVASRIERHIKQVLEHDSELGEQARTTFDNFLRSLHDVINPMVTKDDALAMLVQHIITKPIFDVIFEQYAFLSHNPVSQALDRITDLFKEFIEKETGTLQGFYHSVYNRARGMDKEAERQEFLSNLYDTFFKTAFPKTSDRLGIVYTPVELVDFLVKSVDVVLQEEFSCSLADKDVVILEPFTGTGTFLSRLMHFIPPEKLKEKYNKEIWGNEILLLPYYIALANIESTYYEITGEHKPFGGLILTDSFQLMEDENTIDNQLFPERYTESLRQQKQAKINVILSNPPWYSRQEMEGMNNQNLKYEKLDEKIQKTYAAHTTVTLKNALYDSYIRAIRLATDRIEDKGVIAFVTNNGFIDSNLTAGLRKHLAEEFSKVYVLNLRGNARLSGEAWRKEGGKIFGQGSRSGVALLILVKDKNHRGPATICYHNIGDYLSREEKLAKLKEYQDISRVNWEQIKPNKSYDWINQRSDQFTTFPSMGNKDKNAVRHDVIFNEYSLGVSTNRDAWVYNYSHDDLEENISTMIDEYNKAVETYHAGDISDKNIDDFIHNEPYKVKWSSRLKQKLIIGEKQTFSSQKIILSMYRPYIIEWLYFDSDRVFNERIGILPKLFPKPDVNNIVITVPGQGSKKLDLSQYPGHKKVKF